jgi:putative spermidine/putrescine transport system permease protein
MLDKIFNALLALPKYLIYLFLIFPIVIIIAASFTTAEYTSFPPVGFGFRWYLEFARNKPFIQSALLSFLIAIVTSIFSTTIGLMSAFAIVRYRFPGRDLLATSIMSPLILPRVVLGVALLQFYSPLGLIGNPISFILGHFLITIPYTVRLIMASLSGFDINLELASLNLGASRMKTLQKIILPLIAPGVFSALAFAFIVSFDEIVISMFLTSPHLVTLPVRLFNFIDQSSSPMVTSIGVLLIFISIGVFIILERFIGVSKVFGVRQ